MSALLLACLSLLPFNPTLNSLDIGPVIFTQDEVRTGEDLVGWIFAPESYVRVTVRIGKKVLWSSHKDWEECEFCVPVPDDVAGGLVTVEAEDDSGNTSSVNVPIIP